MPEINPYEPPQSNSEDQRQLPDSVNVSGYPEWIGRALNAQMTLILGLMILAMFVTGPPSWFSEFFAIALITIFLSLTLVLFFAAISYRIGWLVMLELIVLSLPFTVLFKIVFA